MASETGKPTEASKPAGDKPARRGLEATVAFEVYQVHDPDADDAGQPAEGDAYARPIAGDDGAAAGLHLGEAPRLTLRGRRVKPGDRFVVRLPLERIGAADDD